MGFISPFLKVICPFCFERFHPCDAPSRSTSLNGPTEPDIGIGKFLGVTPPEMPPIEQVPVKNFAGRFFRRMWISHNPNSGHKKVCPRCHMFLPHKMACGELKSEILAIVGARNAGKSNFFGVLINALEGRYAREVGFSMFAQDTFSVHKMQPVSSRELYQMRYGSRLFSSQPTALNSTPSATTNSDIKIPLIFRMQFSRGPWQWLTRPFARLKALDLVIFDAAGEDLQDTVMRQQFARYIAAASGIVFLIDPFAFPGIAELLPPSLRSRLPQHGDVREVIHGVINLIEQHNKLRADQKIPIPVAVAFTKTDMLEGIIDSHSPILRERRHLGGFDVGDCQECSEEVERYLCAWGCRDLSNLVSTRFEHNQFFAISALGQLPGEDLKLPTISPRSIADPLLWLLWKRGYISCCPESY